MNFIPLICGVLFILQPSFGQSSSVTITCMDTNDYRETGLTSILINEATIGIRQECPFMRCFIEPESETLQTFIMNKGGYRYDRVEFPVSTWSKRSMEFHVDTGTVEFNPNSTGYMYELPRKLTADTGTFSVRCMDARLNPIAPPLPEDEQNGLSSGTIAAIVIVSIVVMATVTGIIIFLVIQRKRRNNPDKKIPASNINNNEKQMKLGGGYKSLDLLDTETTPMHSRLTINIVEHEDQPSYVDPNDKCKTSSPPHHYMNTHVYPPVSSSKSPENEYSYAYANVPMKTQIDEYTLEQETSEVQEHTNQSEEDYVDKIQKTIIENGHLTQLKTEGKLGQGQKIITESAVIKNDNKILNNRFGGNKLNKGFLADLQKKLEDKDSTENSDNAKNNHQVHKVTPKDTKVNLNKVPPKTPPKPTANTEVIPENNIESRIQMLKKTQNALQQNDIGSGKPNVSPKPKKALMPPTTPMKPFKKIAQNN